MSKMRYTVDTGNRLPTHILYLISYKNEGRNEQAYTETADAAKKVATNLKQLGTQNVRIRPPEYQQ